MTSHTMNKVIEDIYAYNDEIICTPSFSDSPLTRVLTFSLTTGSFSSCYFDYYVIGGRNVVAYESNILLDFGKDVTKSFYYYSLSYDLKCDFLSILFLPTLSCLSSTSSN